MLKMFRKSFWVPREDGAIYPTAEKARQAIIEYCEKNGHTYAFTGEDEVTIDGIAHDICRGYDIGCRGYGFKCRET